MDDNKETGLHTKEVGIKPVKKDGGGLHVGGGLPRGGGLNGACKKNKLKDLINPYPFYDDSYSDTKEEKKSD